jgi:hypothetical protein
MQLVGVGDSGDVESVVVVLLMQLQLLKHNCYTILKQKDASTTNVHV